MLKDKLIKAGFTVESQRRPLPPGFPTTLKLNTKDTRNIGLPTKAPWYEEFEIHNRLKDDIKRFGREDDLEQWESAEGDLLGKLKPEIAKEVEHAYSAYSAADRNTDAILASVVRGTQDTIKELDPERAEFFTVNPTLKDSFEHTYIDIDINYEKDGIEESTEIQSGHLYINTENIIDIDKYSDAWMFWLLHDESPFEREEEFQDFKEWFERDFIVRALDQFVGDGEYLNEVEHEVKEMLEKIKEAEEYENAKK